MRLLIVLALAAAGCGSDPVLAGRQGPPLYGGLMFYQGAARFEPLQLHYLRERGAVAEPVDPPLIGGSGATLSRDGEWIAWVDDDARIRVRSLRSHSNEAVTPLIDYSISPHWSPGGRYLMYVRRPGAKLDWTANLREIVVLDLVTRAERVVQVNAAAIQEMDWSPRGDLLVWQRTNPNQIELATLDGQVIRRLSPEVDSVSGVLSPVFSPDGRRVAFVEAHPYTIGHSAVVVVDLEGRVITRRAMSGVGAGLAWSPSGNELAFCVQPALPDFGRGPEQVDVLNLQTGDTWTASRPEVVACNPLWGPR